MARIRGTSHNDRLRGTNGNDVISGLRGNDRLDGRNGNDTLKGGGGRDKLKGGLGDDKLVGAGGNDVVEGGAGADTLNGGTGINTLSYASDTTSVRIYLGNQAQLGHAAGDIINWSTFQNLTGGHGSDELQGSTTANIINGGDGNDFLLAFAGTSEGDTLNGGSGSDYIVFDSLNALSGATLNLALTTPQDSGVAGTLTLSSIEKIEGTNHDDVFTGNQDANNIDGQDGDDIIEGGAGADVLFGSGNGATGDTLTYAGSSQGITITLQTETGSGGDAEGDSFSGFEHYVGSAHNDTFDGASAADHFVGDAGDDTFIGRGGADTLTGGADNDKFVFNTVTEGGDTITDFVSGVDVLEFHSSGFTGTFADPPDLASGSTPAPSNGNAWFLYDTDDGKLYFDADGNGGANTPQLIVTLDGAPSLAASDLHVV
jgi:Ca2+-binding RTX toxin-like protein